MYLNTGRLQKFANLQVPQRLKSNLSIFEKHLPKMEKNLRLFHHFDEKYRGVVLNEFLYYIRSGEKRADILIQRIEKKVNRQKGWRILSGTSEQWDRYFSETNYNEQLDDFYEALKYAEEWEKKPTEEKEKIKSERSEYFIKQSMKGKPATEKQKEFLKSKGINEIPNDRYECSEIIDKLIKI